MQTAGGFAMRISGGFGVRMSGGFAANTHVIEKSIDLVTQGKRVYWVGGIDAYNIETLLHLHFLKTEQVHRIKDKKLLGVASENGK